MAFECPAKGSFRAVAESMSGFARAHALLTKPTPGEGHPPAGQVLHGRHAHKPREALSKDRAGQVDLPAREATVQGSSARRRRHPLSQSRRSCCVCPKALQRRVDREFWPPSGQAGHDRNTAAGPRAGYPQGLLPALRLAWGTSTLLIGGLAQQ